MAIWLDLTVQRVAADHKAMLSETIEAVAWPIPQTLSAESRPDAATFDGIFQAQDRT